MTKIASIQLESGMDLEPLRRFIREKVLPDTSKREQEGTFPLDLFQDLHRLGWLQALIPDSLGGLGTSTADLIHLFRELAYGSPGMATSLAGNYLAHVVMAGYGSTALRDEVSRPFVTRFSLASFCFTEADSGSDVLSIRTKAQRVPGGYLLSGQKSLITNVNYAEHLVVLAKIEGIESPKQAITCFYVPTSAAGVTRGKPYQKLGHADSDTGEVFFENVFIPDKHRIGDEGQGLAIAFHSIGRSRTFLSAAATGVCQRCLDLVRENLGTRIRFGKPLLAQPTIQGLMAQSHAETQAVWLLTCAAAAYWDAGDRSLIPSSMAKLMAGQVASKVAGSALELFGGWGYLRVYEIERLFRDAKLYELAEGASMVQHAIIAKELFTELRTPARTEKLAA